MSEKGSKDYIIKRREIIVRNLYYLSTLAFYLLIIGFIALFIPLIDINDLVTVTGIFSVITPPFIVGLGVILGGIIFNQKVLIPQTLQIKEPYFRYRLHMLCLFITIETTVIISFIIGFLPFEEAGNILWTHILTFFVLSFIYLLYFYFSYYYPSLSEIEVGKVVRVKVRKHLN